MRTFMFRARTLAVLLAAACNAPQLVDRTQPNYVKKSDLLDSVWYYKNTIVGSPNSQQTLRVGQGGRLDKLRFEIQENLLVGYRTYEPEPGRDPRVDTVTSRIGDVRFKDGTPYKGAPVVAYKIESHFDRQRQYNAATGEPSNVLEENTSDRPWYERDYMRVDWNGNLIQNWDQCDVATIGGTGGPRGKTGNRCFGASGSIPRYYTEQDSDARDNVPVWHRDALGSVDYFDFTDQIITNPASLNYPGYGQIPYCFVDPSYDCDSASVLLRTAFKKVDTAHVVDYEPLVYDDHLMVKFGFFRLQTYAYDKGYGWTDQGRLLFAMRHNIWQRAHDPQLITTDNPLGTIKVTQRELKPIAYHLTGNFPPELLPAASGANSLESSWDGAFRRSIAVPRGLDTTQVPQMFFICENPVPDYSKRALQSADAAARQAACGAPGTYVRMGDTRYHQITYVEHLAGGLLGFGPSFMDPETGEVVWATANMFGKTLDSWVAGSQQVIDLLDGDLSVSQLIKGQDIKSYVAANLNPADPRRPRHGPNKGRGGLTSDTTKSAGSFGKLTPAFQGKVNAYVQGGSLPLWHEDRGAVVDALIANNPDLQAQLVNLPEVQSAVLSLVPSSDFQAKLQSDPAFYGAVARQVMMGTDPVTLERQAIEQDNASDDPANGCYYSVDYDDPDYVGTAKAKLAEQVALVTKYQSQGAPGCQNPRTCTPDEAKALAKADIYTELRREAWRQVAEHEVGHTLGLRHNFIASADALNYQDGYWDLRKQTIGVQIGGMRVMPITPQNMLDATAQTQDQLDNGMYEYTYSSIMDYGARPNAMNKGIGKYDRAAILFGYSGGGDPGWVEVFNNIRNDYDDPNYTVQTDNVSKQMLIRSARLEIPVMTTEHYTPVNQFIEDKFHYTTLPFMFAEKNLPFDAALDQGIERMGDRSYRKWSELSGWYANLLTAVTNYDLSEGEFFGNDWQRARDIMSQAGRGMPVEVPYWYCSDSELRANLMCNQHDEGADIYEMSSKWMERYQQTYVFTNFRRNRLYYTPASVTSGKYSRYLGNMPNIYQQWLFDVYNLQRYYGYTPEQLDSLFGLGDPIWQNYWTMAVVDSTNLLMQQLATPSVGYHGKDPSTGRWVHIPDDTADNQRIADATGESDFITRVKAKYGYTDVTYVPRGPGRSMFTQYSDLGFDFYKKTDEVGHFWDQAAALAALTRSATTFLGVDRGADALKYSLPYYLTFDAELAPLFSAVWTEDRGYYASGLARLGDGTASVVAPIFLRGENYISGFDYPPPPPIPVDNTGNPVPMDAIEAVPPWGTRFYDELLGMAYFTDNYNQEFAMFNQVFKLGAGDALQPASDFTVLTIDDPFGGGYTYSALERTLDPKPFAAAPKMVLRTKGDVDKWNQARNNTPDDPADDVLVDGLSSSAWEGLVREDVRDLEMMRGLYGIFGKAL
jgi:hypothetical protein